MPRLLSYAQKQKVFWSPQFYSSISSAAGRYAALLLQFPKSYIFIQRSLASCESWPRKRDQCVIVIIVTYNFTHEPEMYKLSYNAPYLLSFVFLPGHCRQYQYCIGNESNDVRVWMGFSFSWKYPAFGTIDSFQRLIWWKCMQKSVNTIYQYLNPYKFDDNTDIEMDLRKIWDAPHIKNLQHKSLSFQENLLWNGNIKVSCQSDNWMYLCYWGSAYTDQLNWYLWWKLPHGRKRE